MMRENINKKNSIKIDKYGLSIFENLKRSSSIVAWLPLRLLPKRNIAVISLSRLYFSFLMKKEVIKMKLWLFKSDFTNFLWFQKRAFKCLVGKEGIIDSREVILNGGYKYKQLEISKMPLSKTSAIS